MMPFNFSKAEAEIRESHRAACDYASSAILAAIKCGRLLATYRDNVPHGEWSERLKRLGISEATASRYKRIVIAADAKTKQVEWLIKDGAGLMDLYRAFGIVKPCPGGGYDPNDYIERKKLAYRNATGQTEFHFEDQYEPAMRGLIHSPTVEELGEATLRIIKRDLTAGLQRIDSLLQRSHIDITPATLENHECKRP